MNGRNIFITTSSPHLHHIFTKPCVSLLQMNGRNIFQQTCEISCVGLLQMNGRNIFQQTCEISCVGLLRMNGRNIFITNLHQTLRKSLAYEWSKYILRKSIAYEWSKYILRRSLAKYIWRMNGRNNFTKPCVTYF